MQYSEKKVQIMEAAETLFAEKGFNGTSVRDIAEKANVNLAMISYYFGSKEKLLEALFEYRGEMAKLKLESILQAPGLSALERVYLMVDNYIDKIMSQQGFHRILTREQVLNNTEGIAGLILEMKKTNLEIISRLIREGQDRGEFRSHIDIPLMTSTLVGTASNLITSKRYYKELSNLQHLTEEQFQDYLREALSNHLKFLFKILLTHEA
ncbi:MAG TPA: TetR family transcriptional regulator [Chitinophagaceae bacterium]|nr:TetR family transcriptional regulator [Chitinophagaceae bacterium]